MGTMPSGGDVPDRDGSPFLGAAIPRTAEPGAQSILRTFAVQFPAMGLAVAAGILTARMLGPAGRGALAVLQADAQLLVLVFGFSLGTAVVYFVASRQLPLRAIMGAAAGILAAGTAFTIALVAATPRVPGTTFLAPAGYWNRTAAAYLVLSFVLTFSISIASAALQGWQRFAWLSRLGLLANALHFLAIGGLALAANQGLVSVRLGHVLVATLAALAIGSAAWIAAFLRLAPESAWPRLPRARETKQLSAFVSAAHLANLMQFLNYRVDVWIVEHYRGVGELGLYSVAVALAQLLWMISLPVSGVLLPHLAAGRSGAPGTLIATVSRLNLALVTAVALVAFFAAPLVIPALLGKAFAGAVTPFRLLLPGMVASCATKIFVPFLQSRKELGVTLRASLLGLVFTVVLDLALIPTWGIVGAALATAVSYTATFGYVLYRAQPMLGLPGSAFFLVTKADLANAAARVREIHRSRH